MIRKISTNLLIAIDILLWAFIAAGCLAMFVPGWSTEWPKLPEHPCSVCRKTREIVAEPEACYVRCRLREDPDSFIASITPDCRYDTPQAKAPVLARSLLNGGFDKFWSDCERLHPEPEEPACRMQEKPKEE